MKEVDVFRRIKIMEVRNYRQEVTRRVMIIDGQRCIQSLGLFTAIMNSIRNETSTLPYVTDSRRRDAQFDILKLFVNI